MSRRRNFIPETSFFHPEKLCLSQFHDCNKSENHELFLSPVDVQLQNLPEKWRKEEIIPILKNVSRRIAHLTVLKPSSSRPDHSDDGDITCGTGFITFHPVYGAIVHTSKHVVYDDFEASKTVVRLFHVEDDNVFVRCAFKKLISSILGQKSSKFADDFQDKLFSLLEADCKTSGLFLSRGNSKYFRSVMCCDYTAFTCDMPIHELFSQAEVSVLQGAFSWWNFSIDKFLLCPLAEIDIAVISHPHGVSQKIAFGKMNRLVNSSPSLYDVATCQGSSGSPIIRLHTDNKQRLVSVGQFIHHGHNKCTLDLGMGMIRPPFAFPYIRSLDTESALVNGIGILYEPICYWSMFVADLLHIESTLMNSLDVFAYTSSVSALFLTVHSTIFQVLFAGFWLHMLCGFLHRCKRAGFRFALANTILTFISMSMFMVAWMVIFLAPWPFNNMFVIAAIWLVVLFLERYFNVTGRFVNSTFGSFPEMARFRLQVELGIKLKKQQHSRDWNATQKVDSL